MLRLGDGEADLALAGLAIKPALSIVVPDKLSYSAQVNVEWTIRFAAP